jgi:hypothetical protein
MPLPSLSNLLPFKSNLNAPPYAEDGAYVLQLASAQGTFVFHAYEIPESLANFGGEQLLAVHNFPGGIRTVQALGYFPAKVRFNGWLFPLVLSNIPVSTALDRMQALKNICNDGTPVTLSYGGVTLTGVVEFIHFNPRNQFRIAYQFSMIVTKDASQIQNAAQVVTQRAVLQQWANAISVVQANPSMPYEIGNPLALFQDGLTSLLLKYNNATATDFQNVLNLAGSVSGAINPFITGSNSATPELQSLALQTNAAVSGVTNAINSATTTALSTVQVANPNLFSVASGVYGDATQAPLIAAANGLTDLQPLGQYNLILPPPPTTPPGS